MIRTIIKNALLPNSNQISKNVRFLSQSTKLFEKSLDQPASPSNPSNQPKPLVPLSNFDKRILVWSGKFKAIGDVPANIQ